MDRFINKDSLFNIVMDVRGGRINQYDGLKKILRLLKAFHGEFKIVDKAWKYIPEEDAYADYANNSSSVIKMPEANNNSTLGNGVKIAMLKDAQFHEEIIGQQICYHINARLNFYDPEYKIYLLEREYLGISVPTIAENHSKSRSYIYSKLSLVKKALIREFKLFPRDSEKENLKLIKNNIKGECGKGSLCERILEKVDFKILMIQWEEMIEDQRVENGEIW